MRTVAAVAALSLTASALVGVTAPAEASRMTVRMVPSTGFATAA